VIYAFYALYFVRSDCYRQDVCLGQASDPLRLEREIPLPGVEGRIDHLSVDADGQRVFVSALGNGTVEVIDLKQGRPEQEIKGLKEPQGVLYQGQSHKLYVASGGDGTLRVYDGTTLAPLKTFELGSDADNLRYDSKSNQVLVGYGSGGLAGFDSELQKVFDIKLAAHPESFQLEEEGPRIFVNLPKNLSIAVVDRKQRKDIDKWHGGTALSIFPMALDERQMRLFVGFRLPARLLVFNTQNGKAVAKLPIVGDSDDLFFDEARHLIYVIGGEGFVDVFRQKDADHYELVTRITTAAGARTGLFVPSLNRLFVAVPHRDSQPARVLVYLAVGVNPKH
jgi:DNA-binding beta-propeller fold protein YncE